MPYQGCAVTFSQPSLHTIAEEARNQKYADNNKTETQPLELTHPKLSGFCFTVAFTQNFLFLVFLIPWEPSCATQQGQDAVPWFSRVAVTGHSQQLRVSLCDTLGLGHVGLVTKVCVVTSPSFLGARLPWWRGWHSPCQAQLRLSVPRLLYRVQGEGKVTAAAV